jgi:hypothetical protein
VLESKVYQRHVHHGRDHVPSVVLVCMARIAQGTAWRILAGREVKLHKVRGYLELRDLAFEPNLAEALCVCQEAAILRAVESDAVKACPGPRSSVRDDPGTANKTASRAAFTRPQKPNSSRERWPISTTSTMIPVSTLGPTGSTCSCDKSRSVEKLY